MTGNQSKSVKEYNKVLRSSPNKIKSPKITNKQIFLKEKISKESSNEHSKKSCNIRNNKKLNDTELVSFLDLTDQSENEISDTEEDIKLINKKKIAPQNSKKSISVWRVSDSPSFKSQSAKNGKSSCEKVNSKKSILQWEVSDSPIAKYNPPQNGKSSCEQIRSPSCKLRNMSPAKTEQLSKVRRSLNLELSSDNETMDIMNRKSSLKIKLKRKIIDTEENQDVSPSKTIRSKSSTQDTKEEPDLFNKKLRSRDEIKLPFWRKYDKSGPLKEIQSCKEKSPQTTRCETPQRQKQIDVSATTPKSNKRVSLNTPDRSIGGKTYGTPVSKKLEGRGFLTPIMAEKHKNNKIHTPQGPLDKARVQLHISTIPSSLPCREKEFKNIYGFLKRKIEDHAGGCMYISGVPGTGKTVTVHSVVRFLQQLADDGELDPFDFVEVNGLRLTEPRQSYVRILQILTGQKLPAEQAQRTLDKKFSGKTKRSTVLLVDELDYLCNRRQDVIYNILDWPSKRDSGLVVLTISNTMDLPERTLKGRVTSRMGLTRLMFQPYSHHQLQEIVLDRLAGNKSFHPDAVQLVARKVAAVSGDARRALDICRRATELVSENNTVTVTHVESALTQIFTGLRVLAIRSCCKLEQLVLRSLRDETQRTGVDESNVRQVYHHLRSICSLEGNIIFVNGVLMIPNFESYNVSKIVQ
uniref:Origin recognition complex subunit 1 n=1 Tax=Clastoptera arizonana TaxID=38151 RepID=A0A1B6DK75_9HEMI